MTRAKNAAPGSCKRCGRRPPKAGCKNCVKCLLPIARASEKLKAKRKALGLCRTCGKPAVPGRVLCEYHRSLTALRQRERARRLALEFERLFPPPTGDRP